MGNERDPRIDPIAGDVVQSSLSALLGGTFYVLRVENGQVDYQQTIGQIDSASLDAWRAAAITDTIIKRGDTP